MKDARKADIAGSAIGAGYVVTVICRLSAAIGYRMTARAAAAAR